jgi:hypothetical protein
VTQEFHVAARPAFVVCFVVLIVVAPGDVRVLGGEVARAGWQPNWPPSTASLNRNSTQRLAHDEAADAGIGDVNAHRSAAVAKRAERDEELRRAEEDVAT